MQECNNLFPYDDIIADENIVYQTNLIITSKRFNVLQSEKSCNCQVFLIFRLTFEKSATYKFTLHVSLEKNQ